MIDELKAIVAELEQEHQMATINIELVDNEMAIVYMNSKKGEVRNKFWFVFLLFFFILYFYLSGIVQFIWG